MEEEILKIIGNNPLRLRESFFVNNYPEIHEIIFNYTSDLNLPFKQRIWHFLNKEKDYITCKACGNRVTFNKNWLQGYKLYCSSKCTQSNEETKKKREKTLLEKYGVDNIAKLDETKKKQEETNYRLYGTKASSQNEIIKNKYKNSIKEKYGVDYYFKTDEFKMKSKLTNLEKYGKEYYTQTDEYLKKVVKTNIDKYGEEWPTRSQEIKDKTISTNLERYGYNYNTQSPEYKKMVIISNNDKYGVDHFYQSDYFKKKVTETNIKKYGVKHFSQSENYQDYIKSDKYKISKLRWRIGFYKDRGFEFVLPTSGENVILKDPNCLHEFEIHPTNLQRRILANVTVCTVCNPISSFKSGQETNVYNWIKSLGVNVENSNRSVLNPYEIDIYLPDHKIAIEYNGLYWHSDVRIDDKNYHYNKSKSCRELGVKMLHIWEDDWLYKQDIIKSMILSKIGIIKNKVYARKCDIRIINDKDIIFDFLNKNHIQGKCSYAKSIGLFYNDELVSIMLFGKPKRNWELLRFCSKINTLVVGGASKLFKYFISNFTDVDSISTYSDISQFSGGVYDRLGFKFQHLSPINYWWVVNGIRRHRFSYNKKKLIKMGGDPNKTEVEIMYEMGHYRIFGCGHEKWSWKRDINK